MSVLRPQPPASAAVRWAWQDVPTHQTTVEKSLNKKCRPSNVDCSCKYSVLPRTTQLILFFVKLPQQKNLTVTNLLENCFARKCSQKMGSDTNCLRTTQINSDGCRPAYGKPIYYASSNVNMGGAATPGNSRQSNSSIENSYHVMSILKS